LPLTRRSKVTPHGCHVTVEVAASRRRFIDAQQWMLTFETPDTALAWARAFERCVCGPLGCVYGGDLAVITQRSPYVVPAVLYTCVSQLKMRALNEEGLFRVPGNNEAINALRSAADAQVPNLAPLLSDPHTVAGAVKSFFRDLSDPVVPFARYAEFTALGTKNGQGLDASAQRLRELVASLPQPNRYTLAFIIHFLTLVARNSSVNMMAAKNCAMVFAPTLMRPDESAAAGGRVENPQALADLLLEQEGVVRLMIDEFDTIFPRGSPYV